MSLSSPPCHNLKLSFDTVFYYVTDIEDSIAFYRDTLGLPMVSRDYVARFDLDGVLIELVPRPPGMVVPGSGNARLCFSVTHIEDAVKLLQAQGIVTGDIRHQAGGRLALFRDPDGNELALWEYEHGEDAEAVLRAAEFHL